MIVTRHRKFRNLDIMRTHKSMEINSLSEDLYKALNPTVRLFF